MKQLTLVASAVSATPKAVHLDRRLILCLDRLTVSHVREYYELRQKSLNGGLNLEDRDRRDKLELSIAIDVADILHDQHLVKVDAALQKQAGN